MKAKRWEQVLAALSMLAELLQAHLNEIDNVTRPVLEGRDVVATARRYQTLAYDIYFPIGYGIAKGQLEQAREIRQFQKDTILKDLDEVLNRTREFQQIAYLLKDTAGSSPSYGISDDLESVAQLWTALTGPDERAPPPASSLPINTEFAKANVLGLFSTMFGRLSQISLDNIPPLPVALSTSEDLLALVQGWCRQWRIGAHKALTSGRGIGYPIGELMVHRYI